MSVDYNQYCIVGIMIDAEEECKNLVSAAIFEEQPRYDTKTGKQTHTEKVLIKDEVIEYECFGVKGNDIYELVQNLQDKFPELDVSTEDCNAGEYIYIGKSLGDSDDYARVSLLDGEISFDQLNNLRSEVASILNIMDLDQINLYFYTCVG